MRNVVIMAKQVRKNICKFINFVNIFGALRICFIIFVSQSFLYTILEREKELYSKGEMTKFNKHFKSKIIIWLYKIL